MVVRIPLEDVILVRIQVPQQMKRKIKEVPFCPNTPDNFHCLQACIKMLLLRYFPDKKFADSEIDAKTLQEGGHTWLAPAACWLDELGLKTQLFLPDSLFNYATFANEGEKYLRKQWPLEKYQKEENNGALKNIDKVQNACKVLVSKKLWTPDKLDDRTLSTMLEDCNTLAIGKTIYEWLSGNYVNGNPHYVLVVKQYRPGQWRIQDPGRPPKEDKIVSATINGNSIFSDILVVFGPK